MSPPRIPLNIELQFLKEVFSLLRLDSSPCSPLKIPSHASLNFGLTRGAPNSSGMEIPTIFLVGTSILDRVADPLIEMTKKLDVNVVKCFRGG